MRRTAQIELNPGELDENFKIEESVREILESGGVADVPAIVIENHYEIGDDSVGRNLDEMCAQICANLAAKRVRSRTGFVSFARI